MNVSDTIYTTLRHRLMSSHYEPGTRLKEEALAEELNVSRTPVRAAIQKLVTDGFLDPAPKRGAVVAPFGKSDIVDIFNLRIVLEGYSASLAAERATKEQIDAMRETVDVMEHAIRYKKPGYQDELFHGNKAFHKLLYESSSSPLLRNFGYQLLDFSLLTGRFYIYSDDEIRESISQHSKILNAISSGNAHLAQLTVGCHLGEAVARFSKTGFSSEESEEK